MSAAAAAPSPEERVRASVLGMILFIASETMFFGGLFAALFTLRAQAPAWPPPGTPAIDLALPLVLTGVLLASSATQHLALEAGRAGDIRGAGRWLGCTVALGLLFLLGEGYEWAAFFNEGFTVSTNVFGTLFFTITGFHGLHLAAGLAILLLAGARARRAAARGRRVAALESATLYWHFVDGVWILVVTSLYVLTALA